MENKAHIVIVGGGFGGLTAARAMKKLPAQITLVDRRNHHLFQPLLYQVATAGLSPADIASPIRSVLKNQKNAEVMMAEVTGVDPEKRLVHLDGRSLSYDYLVLATGAHHSYFGHEEWASLAPGLKSVVDAIEIRRKILLAFEGAEMESDPVKKAEFLTFILVGAGPTGVEMAGSIAELSHYALKSDFRHIDPTLTRVLLLEASPRILAHFPEDLSRKALRSLKRLGVEVRTGARVENIDSSGVMVSGKRIASKTVIWTAGVISSPAGNWVGAEVDRVGRAHVGPNLSVQGHPEIFVIGDAARVIQDGVQLPGVAPVAMQQGRFVAQLIRDRLSGKSTVRSFRYRNKGNLATIGRSSAVADFGKIHLSGFVAWVTWLTVHIFYLIGFRNRVIVMLEWAWAYVTFQRGARLITTEEKN